MKASECLKKLSALGTAQNRKIYARHGVVGDAFGVSYANLGKLKKAIKSDHELAVALWKSKNHDARILATMIADPKKLTAATLDGWVKDCTSYPITDAFCGVAARARSAKARMEKWMKARAEMTQVAAWNLLAYLSEDADAIGDAELKKYLKTIEKGIHSAQNRVRYAMNTAMIQIGLRPSLNKEAIAAAKRVGKVLVDHGDTGCKTPDAASYIVKAFAHRKKMAAKRRAK